LPVSRLVLSMLSRQNCRPSVLFKGRSDMKGFLVSKCLSCDRRSNFELPELQIPSRLSLNATVFVVCTEVSDPPSWDTSLPGLFTSLSTTVSRLCSGTLLREPGRMASAYILPLKSKVINLPYESILGHCTYYLPWLLARLAQFVQIPYG
jgi:hypothetical protein